MHDPSVILTTVGGRLRAERDRLGLNQTEFAAVGGVKRNTQGEYEKDERPPAGDYLLQLRDAGVDVAYVLTGERSARNLTSQQTELIAWFSLLAVDDRAALLTIVRSLAQGAPRTENLHSPARSLHSPAADFRSEKD